MSWNFALILFVLMLVTGVIWVADRVRFKPAREARVAEALARARPSWAGMSPSDVAMREEEVRAEAGKVPWWIEYAVSFFPVILFVFLLRSFLVEPFRIPSGSMLPTLQSGDLILVNKFTYGIRLPVIDHPGGFAPTWRRDGISVSGRTRYRLHQARRRSSGRSD